MRARLSDGRHFDTSKATVWEEETRWDGRNHFSLATGSQWDHERLYRTKGGTYVVYSWSQWQGSADLYEIVSTEDAAAWLSRNEYLEGDAEKAGPKVAVAYAALELA
jgi:hypothetical protein